MCWTGSGTLCGLPGAQRPEGAREPGAGGEHICIMENGPVTVCGARDQGERTNKAEAPWPCQAIAQGIERRAWGSLRVV